MKKYLTVIPMILFSFSGMATLIFEIVWMRKLSLILGSTQAAITAVMASFIFGIAVGGMWGGRLIDRRERPLKIFGVVQITIAISVIGLLNLFSHMDDFILLIPKNFIEHKFLSCFFLSGVILFIPSFLTGSTFPILLKFFTTNFSLVGRNASILYIVNTLGSILGAIITGFFFLEIFGIQNTLYFGVVICGSTGVCALILNYFIEKRKGRPGIRTQHSVYKNKEYYKAGKPSSYFLLNTLTAAFISGFTFFAYEIIWTRIFSIIFPTTTYSFSLMLISFLSGIVLGSWIYCKFLSNKKNDNSIFGLIELGIGTTMFLLISFFGYLYMIFDRFSLHFEEEWYKLTLFRFCFMFLTLLIPATLMGVVFPLLHKLFIRKITVIGKSAGILYFTNSIGSVIGIVLTSYIIIPHIGIKKGTMLLAFMNIILGVIFCINHLKKQKWLKSSLVGFGLLALFFVPALPINDLTTDLFKYHYKEDGKLIFFNEGIENTTIVAEIPNGDLYLMANFNEYVGDTSKISVNSQKKQAHLPLLLHSNPENILFIGFGTGITLGAASKHNNVEKIDCVEISKNIAEASRFFTKWNNTILEDQRVDLFVEDGRNYLLTTDKRYDIIVSEVYKAESSNIVNLYTKEFFETASKRLAFNGLFCQWISLRELPDNPLKALIKTFAESFPHVSLWSGSPGVVGLIGSKTKLSLDIEQMAERFQDPKINSLYSGDIFTLLSDYINEKEDLLNYAGDVRIITDDNPYVEFTIPKTLQYINFEKNLSETLSQMADLIKPLINIVDFHNVEKKKIEHIKERLKTYSMAKRHFLLSNSLFWMGDDESAKREYRKGEQIIKMVSGRV